MVARQNVRIGPRSRASVPSIQESHTPSVSAEGKLDLPFVYSGEIEPSYSPKWYAPSDLQLEEIVLSAIDNPDTIEVVVWIGSNAQYITLSGTGPMVVPSEGQVALKNSTMVQVEVTTWGGANLDVQLRFNPMVQG